MRHLLISTLVISLFFTFINTTLSTGLLFAGWGWPQLPKPEKIHVKIINFPNNIFSPNNDGQQDAIRINYTVTPFRTKHKIQILDKNNQPVKILFAGKIWVPAGSVIWDGTDSNNQTVTEGKYCAELLAGENENTVSDRKEIIIDKAAPEILNCKPAENESLPADTVFRFQAEVTDAVCRLKIVNFYIDNILIAKRIDTHKSIFFSYNTKKLAKGHHTLRITAFDRVMNKAQKEINFFVGAQAPIAFFISSPLNGSFINGAFNCSISLNNPADSARITQAEFAVKKQGAEVFRQVITGAPYSLQINSKNFPDGQYDFEAALIDTNNTKHTAEPVSAVFDNALPQLINILPQENTWFAISNINISGEIIEQNLKLFTINGNEWQAANNCFFKSEILGEGKNTYVFYAEDMATQTVQVNRIYYCDTIAPVLSITAPQNQLITVSRFAFLPQRITIFCQIPHQNFAKTQQ